METEFYWYDWDHLFLLYTQRVEGCLPGMRGPINKKTFNLIPYVKAYDILRKSFHIWIYWMVHNKAQVFSARINLFGSGFWLWRAEYNQIVRNLVIDYIWSNKQLAWIFILRYMTPLWMGASLTRMCILNCINWLMNNHINWIGHLDEEFTLFYIERFWKLQR